MLTTSLAAPFSAGLTGTRALLRGTSLRSMASSMGTIVGAVGLAAGYQIFYEEGRSFISRIRDRGNLRAQANNALMLHLMRSGLPRPLMERIRKARDRMAMAFQIVTAEDETVTSEHREIIETALKNMFQQAG